MPKFAGCNLPDIEPTTTQNPTKTTDVTKATSLGPTADFSDTTTVTSQQTTVVEPIHPSETTEQIFDTTTSKITDERSTTTMSPIIETPRCPEITDPNVQVFFSHEYLCTK